MINLNHRFFPVSADIMAPIYQVMSSQEKHFVGTVSLDTAFLQTYCQVIALSQGRAVIVGASDKTVGDILKQYSDG